MKCGRKPGVPSVCEGIAFSRRLHVDERVTREKGLKQAW
jgi:hypothetical protein